MRYLKCLALGLAVVLSSKSYSDTTPQALPYLQDWSNNALITTNNDWSTTPGWIGSRGTGLTVNGGDPGGVSGTSADVFVSANQNNPVSFLTGGPAEFEATLNTIAITGSGSAPAPYVILHLNTTGQSTISVAYDARDLDTSADDAVQPLALQYRVGNAGNFINVPAAYLADATIANAGQTTPVSVVMPAAIDDQPLVQLRWISINALGNDEWIGIDNVNISAGGAPIDTPPNLAYTPSTASTINFPAGSLTSVVNSQITVTPSGGAGSGAAATTTLSNCAFTGAGASAFGTPAGVPMSFVGNTTVAQNLGLSCTIAVAAASASLSCEESRGGAAPNSRSWPLTCPAATPDVPPTVTGTMPVNGATGVAAASNLVITFSESVTTANGWFGLSCGTTGNVAYTQSGTGSTRTVDPSVNLAAGELCTGTVESTLVTDLDGTTDPMQEDFSFSFTVAPGGSGNTTVVFTAPAQNQNPVRTDGDITVIFSQAVSLGSGALSLSCSGGNITGVVTGESQNRRFRFNPDSNMPSGACTFTVLASAITPGLKGGANLVRNFTVGDYYAAVNSSSTGANLRSTLHPVIDQHTQFTYTQAWDILENADQAPDNFNQIIDVYENRRFTKVTDRAGSGPNTYNREHTWPNSLGFGTNQPGPYTDTHMLYLSQTVYNADRANFPYRDCPNTGPSSCGERPTRNNPFWPGGTGANQGVYPGTSNWVNASQFEAWSARKGDLARAVLYMDIRYEGTNGEINLSLGETTSTSGVMASLTTLRAWHAADPPDDLERLRNDIVYAYQNNRNPFIDKPEYVECLYGNACGGNVPPNLAYAPISGNAIVLVRSGNIASGTLTVTPSGGSGTGTAATSTLGNCSVMGLVGGSVAPATVSFVGSSSLAQTLTIGCSLQPTAQNGTLICNETIGTGGASVRSWPINCPAALADPVFRNGFEAQAP